MKPAVFRKVPGFIRGIFHGTIWEYGGTRKEIYLTFDDGPTEGVTPTVLDILAGFNARATFFSIARNVERNPGLFESVKSAGHATGNHTYSHVKGWYMKDKDYFDDIELASRYIDSSIFRPPYGLITPYQAKVLSRKYSIIMWSVLSADYDNSIPAEKSFNHLIRNTKPGSIVVFHDSQRASARMLEILPKYLEHFTGLGYTFKSIGGENSD